MLFNIASNLLDRVEAEESWRPTIMVNAQLPWSPNPCLVDMVDYISTQNISIIPDPSFPKGASLRFAEFNRGIDDEGNIKKYLVKQASYGGTDLSITQSYVNEYNHHSEKRGYVEVERTINCLFYNFNTLYLLCICFNLGYRERARTIRFQCVRGRVTEAEPKHFGDGLVQQSFTIIGQEHRKKTSILTAAVSFESQTKKVKSVHPLAEIYQKTAVTSSADDESSNDHKLASVSVPDQTATLIRPSLRNAAVSSDTSASDQSSNDHKTASDAVPDQTDIVLIYPFRNAAISAAPSYATSVSSYDHAIDVSKTNSMINIPGVPVKKRCGKRDLKLKKKKLRKVNQKNRSTTPRAPTTEKQCRFRFIIFLCAVDNKWYLSSSSHRETIDCCVHRFHVRTSHLQLSKNDIDDNICLFIKNCVSENIAPTAIRLIVQKQFDCSIDNSTIRSIRNDLVQSVLDEDDDDPDPTGMGPAMKLISLFKKMPDVSFTYVTHHIHSGLVTYQRMKKDTTLNSSGDIIGKPTNAEDIGVSLDAIDSWRRELTIGSDEIMLGFAFVHDDELRYSHIFRNDFNLGRVVFKVSALLSGIHECTQNVWVWT